MLDSFVGTNFGPGLDRAARESAVCLHKPARTIIGSEDRPTITIPQAAGLPLRAPKHRGRQHHGFQAKGTRIAYVLRCRCECALAAVAARHNIHTTGVCTQTLLGNLGLVAAVVRKKI
jgi:hypothetical protein